MSKRLLSARWGKRRAREYVMEIHTLADESGSNEPVLKVALQQGLHQDVCTEIACWDHETSLYYLVDLAIHLDNLSGYHCRESDHLYWSSVTSVVIAQKNLPTKAAPSSPKAPAVTNPSFISLP